MFKLIMLVKKRDGLSDAEFRARWQAHSEKVLGFQAALRIRGYAKTLPLCHDTPATQRDTQPFPYDAMGELWYDSREIFETARQSSKFKIVLRLPAQQCGKFMGAVIANSSARFRRLALKMQIGAGKLNLRRLKRSAS